MLPRVLEPEVMDSPEEASDYDRMDHADVNQAFARDFLAALVGGTAGEQAAPQPYSPRRVQRPELRGIRPLRILDCGCATALVPFELCRAAVAGATRSVPRREPGPISVHVTAIDMAWEMLRLARRNVRAAGLENQINLIRMDAKHLPFDEASFDAATCKSTLHHIPDPRDVLGEMLRVLKPAGLLFARDLLRPPDDAAVRSLVETYAAHENEHSRAMFEASLRAALTLDEVRDVARRLGFDPGCVSRTSDRHWTLCAWKP